MLIILVVLAVLRIKVVAAEKNKLFTKKAGSLKVIIFSAIFFSLPIVN